MGQDLNSEYQFGFVCCKTHTHSVTKFEANELYKNRVFLSTPRTSI